MPHHLPRPRWCPGPRRGALAVLGLTTANMGWIVHTEGPIDPAGAVAFEVIPLPVRVCAWVLFGTAATLCALPRGRRLYGQVGYGLLWAMPMERLATVILAQTFANWYPGAQPGWGHAAPAITMWTLVLLLLCTVMLWPDPADELARARAKAARRHAGELA